MMVNKYVKAFTTIFRLSMSKHYYDFVFPMSIYE